MNTVQQGIAKQLVRRKNNGSKKDRYTCPVYVDGIRYRSLFEAGIESDVSYVSMSLKLKESKGAPVTIGYSVVVSESWILSHPEYLI